MSHCAVVPEPPTASQPRTSKRQAMREKSRSCLNNTFLVGKADRGRHDAQEHAAHRSLLHISAVTSRAGEGGKPVKPSITLRWLHKQQLLHVNEKLPVEASATVRGCYPDSDMCGPSQIMSHARGND